MNNVSEGNSPRILLQKYWGLFVQKEQLRQFITIQEMWTWAGDRWVLFYLVRGRAFAKYRLAIFLYEMWYIMIWNSCQFAYFACNTDCHLLNVSEFCSNSITLLYSYQTHRIFCNRRDAHQKEKKGKKKVHAWMEISDHIACA